VLEDLVISLDQMNEKPAAVTLLDALVRNSVDFKHFDEVAKCYFKIKEYEKAYKNAEKAMSLFNGPDMYSVKYNVLNTANHANYPERALTLIRQLELVNSNDRDVRMEKAFALFLLNRKNEAEEILRKELEDPSIDDEMRTKIKFNLGTYELLKDQFQDGLRKFLFEGRKMNLWKKPEFLFERWEGKIEPGRTIYVRAEAGIGDEFINVRFMKHLQEKGMKPIWYSERKDTTAIFNRCGFKSITLQAEINIRENPCWVHSMDLPVYLNLQYEDLWNGPYLKSDPNISFKDIIVNKGNLKIGIRWQGNPGYDQDLHRSIPFLDMFNAVNDLGADLYSLQRDNGLEEMKDYEDRVIRLDHLMNTYENTLAMMNELDVIITSCTSIGHAAAAMGKRTIIITPISAYYTWCHVSEQSPWYGDNLTLLRQEKPRVWNEPLDKLKEILNEEFGS
jgi:tetratricopeptide (TPR) repeat protein